MKFFNDLIDEINDFTAQIKTSAEVKEFQCEAHVKWPAAGSGEIIMRSETAFELGHPTEESCSFFLWTNDPERIRDGRILLAGPDICDAKKETLPFGKVVIVGGNDFDEKNCYDRFHEMDILRHDVSLKGYMMRAVSQHMREWSRISKEALEHNFSFSILGSALIHTLKELDYVDTAEIIYITSSASDVRCLKSTGNRMITYMNTVKKVMTDADLECTSCEYLAVCEEVEELREIHKETVKLTES